MTKQYVKLWLVMLAVLTGCPKQKDLTPLQKVVTPPQSLAAPKASADIDFCLHRALTRADFLKLIFVIDKSGSNAGDTTTPGSDPTGARRYGTLLSYLGTIPQENQANTFYSLLEFSTDVTPYPTLPNSQVPAFTNNLFQFTTTVTQHSNPFHETPNNPHDAGWTDYLKALNSVKTLIGNDITAALAQPQPVVSHYVIFFISDGEPIIATGSEVPNGNDPVTNLVTDIRNFELTNPNVVGSVQLHTGYYYNDAIQDPDAQILMQQMAQFGNGDAFQFSTGQSIDFSRFQIPEDNVKFAMKDLYLDYDEGVWEDGEFRLASSRGLSDQTKEDLGADPLKEDSDGNGISDLVELKAFGRPCHGSHCEPQLASQFPNCVHYRDSNGNYLDSDRDGLNDCEESILHSDPLNFDSNGSWVTDFFALKRGFGLNSGIGGLAVDTDGDGVPAYFELKQNTPLDFRNDQAVNLSPYVYHLTPVSTNSVQDCYHMTVSNIFVLDTNHHLRAYLMEMPVALEAKKYLRTAVKQIGPTYHVNFSNGDFQ